MYSMKLYEWNKHNWKGPAKPCRCIMAYTVYNSIPSVPLQGPQELVIYSWYMHRLLQAPLLGASTHTGKQFSSKKICSEFGITYLWADSAVQYINYFRLLQSQKLACSINTQSTVSGISDTILDNIGVPFYQYRLTLIASWKNNCLCNKVWDEINYLFPNFNGFTIEV